MRLLRLLFSFRGRVHRTPYWLTSATYVGAIYLVLHFIDYASDSNKATQALIATLANILSVDPTITLPVWFFFAASALVFVSAIAVGIKRLHDRNKSGWWLLVFYGLPVVLTAGADMTGENNLAHLVLELASTAISIWGFIELGFLRGTIGPNKYGPDPRASPA